MKYFSKFYLNILLRDKVSVELNIFLKKAHKMEGVKINTIISKEAKAILSDIIDNYFDSDWYLKTYPEAKKAITSGQFPNALEHYLEIGINEKKSPSSDFDEVNYLNSNEEVRIAVEHGDFKCGYHYYLADDQNQVVLLEMISQEDMLARNLLIDIFNSKIDMEFMEGRHSRIPSRRQEIRGRVSPDFYLGAIGTKR